ncbi:hypothetical protein M409DRAFT_19198 [Zasmidium cellare ATCC 36951]|uniref:F-box domain-containing protein n=1 Tax=Zasmidium cellare ATCC 36951 TaxID=1080233 RepID=A0A6A6CTJ3_ZASCE|nr:uncharacterized protein M409DRAFT_19198 [Zasmidium cellare ATCC 36951]KAF2170375.1 hypothetical protein M409DRAFT_19198 [Zasmidium cellare ATCC 36951]
MALDVQRNWDVCMAENLERVTKESDQPKDKKDARETTRAEKPKIWKSEPVYLPDEIIIQILEYVSRFHESQYTLASCCLLSRQWYSAAVPMLYASPYLYGKNFDPFQAVMIPSRNLHVRDSPLASLVKILDLRGLVHQASRRITARLLGRTKGNLEAFIAPQASFGTNSFAALAKCHQLRILDLSLVSESPPLFELLKTVSRLDNLTTFRLPRSSGFSTDVNPALITWPRRLENLALSGGIDAHFMHGIVALPSTLRSLTIEHCPSAKGFALMHMLRAAVRPLAHLETLKLANLPRLSGSACDNVLFILPGLTRLSISVDYITPALFDFDVSSHREAIECHYPTLPHAESLPTRHQWTDGKQCELRTLELTNSGNPGVEDKVSPIDIVIALDEGALPNLRQVRVDKTLLWQASATAADVDALADALKEAAVQRGEDESTSTGVWTF